jgi:hypothetical protein
MNCISITFVIMNNDVSEIRSKIIIGLHLSFDKLIEFKKRMHSEIIVSKDGKILHLKAEDFQK